MKETLGLCQESTMPRYIPSSITSAFSISGRSTQIRWLVLSRTVCSTDQPLSRRNHREANPRRLQRKTTARRSPQPGLARVGNIATRTMIRCFVTDTPLLEKPVQSHLHSVHSFVSFLDTNVFTVLPLQWEHCIALRQLLHISRDD